MLKQKCKLSVVEYAYDLSTWKAETEGLVQGNPLMHSEFEASLSYIRPCLIINNQLTVVVY